MRIVFWGTSEFAIPALKELLTNGHELLAIITVPDQPVGRKKILTPPPLSVAALELGIPVLQPASLKEDSAFEQFKFLNPDLAVVAAYGKIIPQRYLELPPQGFLNIHPSLLPKYRGATPVQSAILEGESKTGVTIMEVDAEMDHGPIIMQEEVSIEQNETYTELHDRLALVGARLLVQSIATPPEPQEQDHNQATFTKIFTREDARINWNKTGEQIYNQIRALNPEPGTWTTWKGQILNIISAKPGTNSLGRPGLIQKHEGEIVVGTSTYDLALKTIQLEGKNETSVSDFVNGHPDFLKSTLE
ncbi:methionyl-tRNA formyltransferase [Candidatus Parcubacteria bacterium]|nr:methionyl-tRNA formyltransferase [Candidatus Parcubacteria bacterium]